MYNTSSPTTKEVSTELIISEILRWGVRISLAFMLTGVILCAINGYNYGQNGNDLHALISGPESFPRNASWITEGLVNFRGPAIIVCGLALLISTPILRVIASIIAYIAEKDLAYFLITSAVLTVIILSVIVD